ncbi:MAG: hypothetical protein LC650_04570 [Actinobacteria bacterium]|nr:hypothetical protein [Actinomycetota bacterium]
MAKTLRVAKTVNGEIFVVSTILNIGTPKAKVACYGYVVSWKQVNSKGDCSFKYSEMKTFLRDKVELFEVEGNVAFFQAQTNQYLAHLKSKGHVVTTSRTGKTYTDHGTQQMIEARQKYNAEVRELNAIFKNIHMSIFGK